MKTIFKDFLLYTLACIGAVSLLLSVIDKPKENAQPIDRYHITASNSAFVMYNTQTGEYKLLDLRKDKDCNSCIYNDNYDKQSF